MNSHGYGPFGMKQIHYVTWMLHLSEPHLGNVHVRDEFEHHVEGWMVCYQATLEFDSVSRVSLGSSHRRH